MKKITLMIFLSFFLGVTSIFSQSVANRAASQALSQFEIDNPQYAGKAYLTGGNGERTWQKQMEFIITRYDPQKKGPYPNICRRFMDKFGVQLPAKVSDMTSEMLNWWEREIMAQAGRPDGFAHIGGKAQDISVRNLDNNGKALLEKYIRNYGMGIIYETPPTYYVSRESATVFHCYVN